MSDRQKLAASYVPYIRRVAYRLIRRLPPHIAVDDLISAGCEGLLDALEKFDPTRVEKFEQYAEYRVRGAMLDALRTLDPLGRNMRGQSNKLAEVIRDLGQQLGRAPEETEIATALGCTVENYRRLLEALSRTNLLSLDEMVDEYGGMCVEDPLSENPEEGAQRAELRDRLVDAINQLPERHRLVLTLYYVEDLKLREIGELLNVSESRVCQLLAEAVAKLRTLLADQEPSEEEESPKLLAAG